MNTFRKLFLSLLILSHTGAMPMAHAQSTGTTGGGDKDYDIHALLPRSIRIETRYEPKRKGPAVVIGRKRCWGVIPCAIYAYEFEKTTQYDREVSRKHGFEKSVTARGLKGTVSKSLSLQNLLENLTPTEQATAKTVDQALVWVTGTILGQRYFWENNEIDILEYEAQLKNIKDAAIARVVFEQPKTISDLKVIDDFLEAMTLGGRGGNLYMAIGLRITQEFNAQANEILALAKKVVDDTTGTCDQAKYAQVKARLRGFKFGTTKWLEKLSRDSGVNLNALAPDFYQKRGTLHQLMAEDVEPYCSSVTGKDELREEPEAGDSAVLNP